MTINLDNFITVERRVPVTKETNLVRVNGSSIGISQDVGKRFGAKDGRVVVQFQYSAADKALRILENESDGYAFRMQNKSKIYYIALPSNFKALRIPRGAYKALDDQPDIFVLQEESGAFKKASAKYKHSKYIIEDAEFEEGDIVSWVFRAHGRGPELIGTGEVQSVVNGKTWVSPISKNWKDEYPEVGARPQVTWVKTSKLILREKKNGN